MAICDFYENRNILLTGSTGFVGKLILEKLLRVCRPQTVYILVRPKNGKSVNERLNKMFQKECFDLLKSQRPNYRDHIKVLEGDCSLNKLGLSFENQEELIKSIDLIIHCAATVRFDQKLKMAVASNVKATKELLVLAERIANLKAFIYISTAYSNCIFKEIDEKLYEPPISPENLLNIVEMVDDNLLEKMTPILLDKYPNTYVYTKAVAENIVGSYANKIPIAIVRPSIIISAYKEPTEGWIDTIYGPIGVTVAASLGVLRLLEGDENIKMSMIPVDYLVNCILTVGYETAKLNKSELVIYNYVSHPDNSLTIGFLQNVIKKNSFDLCSTKIIWYPNTFWMSTNRHVFLFFDFFYHRLPALLVDLIGHLFGYQLNITSLYKRMRRICDLTAYFRSNQWDFNNQNVIDLWEKMSNQDQELFNFDLNKIDLLDYCLISVKGGRKYILKESMDTLPRARLQYCLLMILHYSLIGLFFLSIGYLLFKWYLNYL